MKSTTLTTLTAILIVGTGGYFAGRISSSPEQGSSITAADSGKRGSADHGSSSAASGNNGLAIKSNRGDRPKKSSSSTETSEARLGRLESIVRGEDPLARARAMLDLIDQLGPNDFEGAIAKFRSLGITEDRFGEYGMLLSAWAKLDPVAALQYAQANTSTPFATSTILSTWASNDPDAAIQWAKANHSGDSANPYMPGIIRSLAATDPTRATQLMTEMPRSRERGAALDSLLPHMLRQGTDAAKNWIASIADDTLRNGATERAAESLAQSDPAGTAAWLLATNGEAKNSKLDDVYSVWISKDKTSALAALSSLPPGEDRSNALRGAIRNVAVENPTEGAALLNRYSGDVTDRVVQNYVWHSFGTDPAAAISQISRMTDPQDRERTYARSISVWMQRDPAAAASWMQSNPLPPAVIDRIEREKNR